MNAVRRIMFKDLRKKLTSPYPFGGPERQKVPEDKVDWSIEFSDYCPPYFTSPYVLKAKSWADKETITDLQPKWNSQDGPINRKSYCGDYSIDVDGYPLNPCGRTGIRGRGNLGKWGPNHAADPIVTRWKETNGGQPVLQFVGIQRKDTGEWAIPGGMIDPGETAYSALKREFLEEVFSIEVADDQEKEKLYLAFNSLFSHGIDIYQGYVDDPRNTDNAWMETHAVNFHTDDSKITSLELKAGSDAKNAKWMDINSSLNLYASHKIFIEKVAQYHKVAF